MHREDARDKEFALEHRHAACSGTTSPLVFGTRSKQQVLQAAMSDGGGERRQLTGLCNRLGVGDELRSEPDALVARGHAKEAKLEDADSSAAPARRAIHRDAADAPSHNPAPPIRAGQGHVQLAGLDQACELLWPTQPLRFEGCQRGGARRVPISLSPLSKCEQMRGSRIGPTLNAAPSAPACQRKEGRSNRRSAGTVEVRGGGGGGGSWWLTEVAL